MKNLTWQNPGQLFVAQELIKKVKLKCCGIKVWNFCKRFSLNQPSAKITQPAGETIHVCMAPQGEATFPDITVRATAKAPNGKVVRMDFYDGNTFIDSLSASPYTVTLSSPAAGKHNLRVEVTDNKDKKADATCLVNYVAPAISYSLYQTFRSEGVVPQNWYVSNGSVKRVGGGLSYTSGPRILRFTNISRSFEYGLLVQNALTREKAAWAKFGDKTARSYLTLHPGRYAIKYKVCNWNQPEFAPVTIAIEDVNGQEVASQIYTPTINIGGDTGNKFTGAPLQTFEFDIPEKGEYIVAFYTDAAKNADFVLGQVTLQVIEFGTTGIKEITNSSNNNLQEDRCYDLSGRKVVNNGQLPKGIYIINGSKVVFK